MTGIIIGGVSRAGKTILTERIHAETGFSMISGDLLVGALGEAFPTLNIRHGNPHNDITDKLWDFYQYLMKLHTDWQGRPFILDSTYLDPDKIFSQKLHEKYPAVFLGYPSLKADEKLAFVRHHDDPDDWTRDRDDEKLTGELQNCIDLSTEIQNKCEKHSLNFYDTGLDFEVESEKAYQFILSRI